MVTCQCAVYNFYYFYVETKSNIIYGKTLYCNLFILRIYYDNANDQTISSPFSTLFKIFL